MDKKKLLLKMLDQQTGGAQQVFAFEEEDNPAGSAGHLKEATSKGKRGRPKKEVQIEEDDDDELMDEDMEY